MRDLRELNLNEGGLPVSMKPPSSEQIGAFESKFQVKLPEDYIALLRFSNGGHPKKDAFKPKGKTVYWGVSRFRYLDNDKTTFDGLWRATMEWQKALSKKIVPIS